MEPDNNGSLPSYYNVLGVTSNSSIEQIRRAYRKLAMWHPDRWTKTPSLLAEANHKFQQIQEAYSVLSDPKKKTQYDVGLYDPQDEENEGFSDFVEEMASLMAQVRSEEKVYGLEELQSMFLEMAKGFKYPSMNGEGSSVVDESGCSLKRTPFETNLTDNKGSPFQVPIFNFL
ncbi:unnamed protein product [Lupinus luteus]|uniref:J domain-containing protein n=1 Tax=Lupinus luteus TaxID=3873 RepID=A0AAV1WTU9_LUPLU